jgi:gluconate kinase
MILIITGASHTGKTRLAQRLMENTKYPYLSIDHLKMGLIRSGNTSLTPEDDDALTEYLWPIVAEIVKTAVENRQNLIIEGSYVPPDWRKSFSPEYLSSIRLVCLVMTEEYIRTHIMDISRYAGVIEDRVDDGWWTADRLIEDNSRFQREFSEETCHLIDDAYSVDPRTIYKMMEAAAE